MEMIRIDFKGTVGHMNDILGPCKFWKTVKCKHLPEASVS